MDQIVDGQTAKFGIFNWVGDKVHFANGLPKLKQLSGDKDIHGLKNIL